PLFAPKVPDIPARASPWVQAGFNTERAESPRQKIPNHNWSKEEKVGIRNLVGRNSAGKMPAVR
ncbi:MAG: hypothetical protein ACLFUS_15310, partial [Candidatus Sumerlaeia bacterium]